ncbi:MAG: hypothetical protein QNJ27_05075, partial [Simkaniaceae bacterium]|nr:hypothetical protein [Simkaniaceae bacterium]
ETHMLVLIPQFVNKIHLTLNFLQVMILSPQGGGHKTNYTYHYYLDVAQREIGSRPAPLSYWALLTKDILPGSRNKTYSQQQVLIKKPYTVPQALEIVTGILMHHVQAGEKLYPASPKTYTRCQERYKTGRYALIGAFSSAGIEIGGYPADNRQTESGMGCVRRF